LLGAGQPAAALVRAAAATQTGEIDMDTGKKRDTERQDAEGDPGGPEANAPQGETETAHRSGQFGADKPGFGKAPAHPGRASDKKHNEKGPEYEEGGQYPGKRPDGK